MIMYLSVQYTALMLPDAMPLAKTEAIWLAVHLELVDAEHVELQLVPDILATILASVTVELEVQAYI
jgi:hypothetical protein